MAQTRSGCPTIDFDRGRFGVVVAQVKTSRDDGGSVEPAPATDLIIIGLCYLAMAPR